MSKLWNNFNDQYNINIFINLQSMVQYTFCYCLYFLNSKALVLFIGWLIGIGHCGPTYLSVSV